jgi:hypothetical protein
VNLIKSSFVVGFSILAIIACGTQPTNSDSQILLRGTESDSSILEIGRGKNSSQEKSKKKFESKSSKKEDCDDEDEEHEDDEHDDDNDEKEGSDESKNASVGCATQQPPSTPSVKPTQPPVQPPAPPVQPPAPPVQPPAPPVQPPMDPAVQLQSQYNSSIKAIIDSRCQTCHAGTNPKLGTFADVKAASSRAAAAVSKGSMPLGAALSAADKASLVDFFTQVSKLP